MPLTQRMVQNQLVHPVVSHICRLTSTSDKISDRNQSTRKKLENLLTACYQGMEQQDENTRRNAIY